MDRVALIREHVPDCAITTDIIVGFPGETEADFEQTLEVVDEVGYDGAFTFVFSPRRETEAATIDGPAAAPGQARADGAAGRARPAARARARAALRRPRRWRSWSRDRAAPTRRGCAAGRATTRPSTSTGSASPGELVEVEITGATSHDAERRRASAQPRRSARAAMQVLAIFGPTGSGRPGSRSRLAEQLRERGRGPGGDLLRRDPGLRGAGDADAERRRPRSSETARAPAARVRARSPSRSASATTCRWRPRARSTRRWRRGGGRSWSAAPASTCGRRWPELSLVKAAAAEPEELASSWSPSTRHPTARSSALGHGPRRQALRADRRPADRGDRRAARRARDGGRRGAAESARGRRRGPRARRSASTSCSRGDVERR